MARIALLPLETVCQGNKRLQATPLARDSENAFLRTHVFQENHARKMDTGFWKDCAWQKRARDQFLSDQSASYRSINLCDRRCKWPKPRETQKNHQEKRDCRELIAARQSRLN
jgi:hypothetical protein